MWLLAGPLTPIRTSQDHHIISWIENMCATTDAWGAHLLRFEAVLLDELYLTSPWDVFFNASWCAKVKANSTLFDFEWDNTIQLMIARKHSKTANRDARTHQQVLQSRFKAIAAAAVQLTSASSLLDVDLHCTRLLCLRYSERQDAVDQLRLDPRGIHRSRERDMPREPGLAREGTVGIFFFRPCSDAR